MGNFGLRGPDTVQHTMISSEEWMLPPELVGIISLFTGMQVVGQQTLSSNVRLRR